MEKYIINYRINGQLAQTHVFDASASSALEKLAGADCVYSIEPFSGKLTYDQVKDMLGEYVNNYHTQQFVIAALDHFGLIGW